MTTPILRRRTPLEREIQRQIVAYLWAAGYAVWQTSQGHKHPTGAKGLRITPGIPDLYALHPRKGPLWVEVKRPGQGMRLGQQDFARRHAACPTAPPVLLATSLEDVRAHVERRP
jgi:hypothetical protein